MIIKSFELNKVDLNNKRFFLLYGENQGHKNEVIKERFVPGMKVGKVGLEKTLENHLIGTNAIQRYEVNAYGKRINQLEYQKGKQGSKIRLTVDTEVSFFLEA